MRRTEASARAIERASSDPTKLSFSMPELALRVFDKVVLHPHGLVALGGVFFLVTALFGFEGATD